jgi:RimJ/RimL family protein N-acetyltransferase
MSARITDTTPLATGQLVILRDRIASDVDVFLHWRTHGEWRLWDAPWEGGGDALTPEGELEYRELFASRLEEDAPSPRQRAVITTANGKPLGWVNRYAPEHSPEDWHLGIDICEDEYLNRGFGTEALWLWLDYLFGNSDVHRISLGTWSFNERMMRVAEKVGFTRECRQREMKEWQGEWIDYISYGVLRREWEASREEGL